MSKVDGFESRGRARLEPKLLNLEEANSLIEKLRRIVASQAQRIFEMEKIIRHRQQRWPVTREGRA